MYSKHVLYKSTEYNYAERCHYSPIVYTLQNVYNTSKIMTIHLIRIAFNHQVGCICPNNHSTLCLTLVDGD
jgi:hypothetical protein